MGTFLPRQPAQRLVRALAGERFPYSAVRLSCDFRRP